MNCCKHQGTTIVLDQFYTIILNEKRASLIRRVYVYIRIVVLFSLANDYFCVLIS